MLPRNRNLKLLCITAKSLDLAALTKTVVQYETLKTEVHWGYEYYKNAMERLRWIVNEVSPYAQDWDIQIEDHPLSDW